MIVDSKYTKTFVSDSLTREKYNELYDYAVYLRDYKNSLSETVSSNLLFFLEMNKFEFVTYMRANAEKVNSNFDKHSIEDVYVAFQNKFNALKDKLVFDKVEFKGFEYYKKNTKKHKKGDLKKVIIKKSKTPLSICLTYLARYGNEDIVDFIKSQLGKDEKKDLFYQNILRYIEKFGFDRLMDIALRKRERIIKRYNKPIKFKKLTFRGRSRKKLIVDYNKNYNSCINAFISLSWEGRKSMDIPVKFAKDYHGKMKDYAKKTNDYEYCLTFNEKEKQIRVNICKSGERYIPSVTESDSVVGIDVNVKHNLFTLSNGKTYDYNRKLVNDYAKLCRRIDDLKKKDKNYKVGKRKQHKLDTLKGKMLKRHEEIISDMCKKLQEEGIRHIAMENLDNGFGKSYVKDTNNEDINFNRIVKFLVISSLKQMIEHIARKYDIAVSTVQSYYTSKMCPICGCIDDENRTTQEEFDCIECEHKDNADLNASINIRNRVTVTVLRDKLLKQLDNGAYEPKHIKREKVKEVLLSYRTSLNGREFELEKDVS